jgi:hypothetical protein
VSADAHGHSMATASIVHARGGAVTMARPASAQSRVRNRNSADEIAALTVVG